MKIVFTLITVLALVGCSEPPKHQIVFTHSGTCRISINDLQFGQANDTDRPCSVETDAATQEKIVSVNFLSETCNAYRYRFSATREGSEGVFNFKPDDNIPNPNCTFLPQYSNPATPWVLNQK